MKDNSTLAQVMKTELAGMNRLQKNDVVEVEFLKKTPRAAYFDLGKFGTGVVFGAELQNARAALKSIKPGDHISARIDEFDGFEGYTELSLAEAGKQKLWQMIKELEEKGDVVEAKITGANQGGLTVDLFGLKAFLPASQLSGTHAPKNADGDRQKMIDELKTFTGQTFSVKVINVNPRNNKLIVSEREGGAASGANLKELLQNYAVGQVVDGLVSGIADFGVFVRFADNPDIEGLVHISEIDYRVIDNPKEVVKLNEAVKVKIIEIKDGRVFLSLKALKPDPWVEADAKYKEGQEVRGKIYKFTNFGAIADILNGPSDGRTSLQGMIHVSEFGGLDEMKAALHLGEEKEFVVSAVKPEERRIILKLRK